MFYREVFERVFTLQLVIAAGVFVVVCGVLLVALVRNRARKRDHLPFAASENNPLEIGTAIVLSGVAAFLVWVSIQSNQELGGGAGVAVAEDRPAAAQIDVEAFRWCWEFGYRDTPVEVTGSCDRGDRPVLVVPAGEPVEFALRSRDVVHSFWVVDLGLKRDAYPDHVNALTMVFPEGRWPGRCSEFCGTHHVDMEFVVQAVPPDQYQQWLVSGGTGPAV
ncbi:cytochrome c oxidase subunit II [Pseudonocardia sp. KRD-184]|uniref:Cytochrome aa3 subunit 2 n=1 Tax=Pseudonocardia oceani TaxID=2792013 RepID=A0ABS6UGA7_9PSEU|nr:cytochrome c oxidase subunit II [Pseudonocardia oceani]MBW0089432.1 cytochrome c oxidase subunit II [Pseudonocardia oceani]MBW0096438.1 cytochrome c oxidase subunit II [Pseudonocardia oceani]MBW0108755.1 cytochrome c oxidase subunit II [Pseudonocardia oceani]MBW0122983.1 cytochrome c oxidase subunit II [Pseudonocardia oceani]MBW0131256.1 cytochrome c oxidase subunit II [Pseudonocardia oceani]